MKKTLITREQFKVMPWKNGAGTTAEIDISPAGSSLQEGNFDWRISSARIEDENRFSQFPGYDRILTVLSGEGLLLNHQELGPFEIFEFQGEDVIDCVPLEGVTEDLGVIFKRDQFQCHMQILNVTSPMYLKLEAMVSFFFPLSLPVEIGGIEFSSPDFLKIEMAPSIELSAKTYPAPVLKIDIKRNE